MRLIDADKLFEWYRGQRTKYPIKKEAPQFGTLMMYEIFGEIDDAPTIEIIRCGECKWRKAKMMPKSVKCLFSGKADDFCSYGERSSE